MFVMVWLCSRTLARPTSASLACLPVRSSSTFAGFTSKLITCSGKCSRSEPLHCSVPNLAYTCPSGPEHD